jgi:hypothetical protein
MTEDWRKRLDATLDAIAQARIQAASDAKDMGKRRAQFLRRWKAALGSAIEPALTEAGEPWRQRGLESSLTVSESPRSATLSVTIEPLGACTLEFAGDSDRMRVAVSRTFGRIGVPREQVGDHDISEITKDRVQGHIDDFMRRLIY